MAKTYTAAGTATAGQVYTAAAHNVIATNVNNFIVPPIASVNLAANAVVATATDTAFAFSSVIDTDSMVTAGTTSSTYANAGKITVTTAGVYLIQYTFTVSTNATGQRSVTVAKNGTGSPLNGTGTFFQVFKPDGTYSTSISGGGLMSLAANDYLQLAVYQNSGGNLTYNTNGATFSATWVGRTS